MDKINQLNFCGSKNTISSVNVCHAVEGQMSVTHNDHFKGFVGNINALIPIESAIMLVYNEQEL